MVKCKKHKTYKGIKVPASPCLGCLRIYLNNHQDIELGEDMLALFCMLKADIENRIRLKDLR